MSLSPTEVVIGLMGCWIGGFAVGQAIAWVRHIRNVL